MANFRAFFPRTDNLVRVAGYNLLHNKIVQLPDGMHKTIVDTNHLTSVDFRFSIEIIIDPHKLEKTGKPELVSLFNSTDTYNLGIIHDGELMDDEDIIALFNLVKSRLKIVHAIKTSHASYSLQCEAENDWELLEFCLKYQNLISDRAKHESAINSLKSLKPLKPKKDEQEDEEYYVCR